MWMTKSKDLIMSGKVFHKHKYIKNPDATPEDQFTAATSKLSQEISGRSCNNHLSDRTLDQLTRLGKILKNGSKMKRSRNRRHNKASSKRSNGQHE